MKVKGCTKNKFCVWLVFFPPTINLHTVVIKQFQITKSSKAVGEKPPAADKIKSIAIANLQTGTIETDMSNFENGTYHLQIVGNGISLQAQTLINNK